VLRRTQEQSAPDNRLNAMQEGRKWRRTTVERHGRMIMLSDDWSLYDEESGYAIARIFAERDGWSWVVRALIDNGLADRMSGWFQTGKRAREFCEAQTAGQFYKIRRKRTKAEILDHAGVRPKKGNSR
jgi:hypothetical protein